MNLMYMIDEPQLVVRDSALGQAQATRRAQQAHTARDNIVRKALRLMFNTTTDV
jgi:hypothetical protein